MNRAATRILPAVVITVSLALMLAACGGNSSTAPPTNQQYNGIVHVVDNQFSPANITISLGDSVTWRWEGTHDHTVTQGTSPTDPPDADKLFDSPLQHSGTFGYRFADSTLAGTTVHYFCRPHLSVGMTGTVKIRS
ncbi:MAG TPA: plastocyanin/azurin family copper-binding protein [Candidatus Krumholzibacteria bacterium]|nr:plastocyanin/azurin family copper-binding protein [Candidatus Krumholzibacteria bacterium]